MNVKNYVKVPKLIASDSDIDEEFKFMHQSIMTKIKNYASEDYIVLEAIIKYSIKIFEYYYKVKNEHKSEEF